MTGVDAQETIWFSSNHNTSAGQIHPIRRTPCHDVELLWQSSQPGDEPRFQAFPRISRHVMRHFALINGS